MPQATFAGRTPHAVQLGAVDPDGHPRRRPDPRREAAAPGAPAVAAPAPPGRPDGLSAAVQPQARAVRVSALAEVLHSDVSTVSRQVSTLVDLGFVRRGPDPDDGRA